MDSCTYAVTALYKDRSGNEVQLWTNSSTPLFGVVVDSTKAGIFIPFHKIINPCGGELNPQKIRYSPGRWHLVYNERNKTITILPYLRTGKSL